MPPRSLLATLALTLAVSSAAPVPDWRQLSTGTLMLADAYLDQPYIVIVAKDANGKSYGPVGGGRWVGVITRNNASEGHADEHLEALYSDDAGATWTTGIRLEAPGTADNAYSTVYLTDFGRVCAVYNMNLDHVHTLPPPQNGSLPRDDEIGHFVMRCSDDAGETWGAAGDRWEVPFRLTSIDRHNSWNGTVKIMWSVDQGKVGPPTGGPEGERRTYHAFTKIGTYMQSPPEEIWLLSSPNLLTEPNASLVTWDLYPDGDVGLQAPRPATTNWEEGHVVPLATTPGFFAICRTNLGYLGVGSTSDPTAQGGWTAPGSFASYSSTSVPAAAGRLLKNSEGPITLKRINTTAFGHDDAAAPRYLLWFYLNSFPGYGPRNPVFLSAGYEEGGELRFSQPELALYDYTDQPNNRPGYPDFVQDPTTGAVYITETNKTQARIHAVDAAALTLLLSQDSINATAQGDLALAFTPDSQGKTFTTPPLFDFSVYTGPSSGATIGLWLSDHISASAGDVLLDMGSVVLAVSSSSSKAVTLTVTDANGVRANVTTDSECTARLLLEEGGAGEGGASHYLSAILDGGAHVLTLAVDGAICDGSTESIAGWSWVPANMGSVATNANPTFVLGEGPAAAVARGEGGPTAYGGRILGGQLYTRWLYNSEVIGNVRAGPPSA
jgi:hypothetical protein